MNFQFNTLPEGLLVTLIGMTIVFVGLVVLIMLITLINRLTGGIGKQKKKAAVATPQYTPAAPAAPVEAAPSADMNQDELIAVITAAVALMMDEGTQFRVRRVRRVSNAPAWQRAGREEQVYSRY